ncbi:MAG: hypothetical protein UX16_C0016G0009 [Parcubacteria group bacterium GW2011_GWB1_45_7]|nr:MAG: hypothetical protein UX16_C0016G0009 [Parcubacteria group bacterium GW2011_GWB1_45_7]
MYLYRHLHWLFAGSYISLISTGTSATRPTFCVAFMARQKCGSNETRATTLTPSLSHSALCQSTISLVLKYPGASFCFLLTAARGTSYRQALSSPCTITGTLYRLYNPLIVSARNSLTQPGVPSVFSPGACATMACTPTSDV